MQFNKWSCTPAPSQTLKRKELFLALGVGVGCSIPARGNYNMQFVVEEEAMSAP